MTGKRSPLLLALPPHSCWNPQTRVDQGPDGESSTPHPQLRREAGSELRVGGLCRKLTHDRLCPGCSPPAAPPEAVSPSLPGAESSALPAEQETASRANPGLCLHIPDINAPASAIPTDAEHHAGPRAKMKNLEHRLVISLGRKVTKHDVSAPAMGRRLKLAERRCRQDRRPGSAHCVGIECF